MGNIILFPTHFRIKKHGSPAVDRRLRNNHNIHRVSLGEEVEGANRQAIQNLNILLKQLSNQDKNNR